MQAMDSNAGSNRMARLRNTTTGMGTELDKSLASEFIPIRVDRAEAETIYQMSWAMARMINIPVEDMFAAGRRWTSDDKSANEAMEKAEAELKLWVALPGAMIASRIWGTAAVIVCPDDHSQFERELDPEDVKEGSIANLVAVDRFSLSVLNWRTDKTKPRYAEPFQYQWNDRVSGHAGPDSYTGSMAADPAPATTQSQRTVVNGDRMIRFDGQRSPLTEGWVSGPWEREWGVSLITRALEDILRDATMTANAAHLVSEASVWVQKIHGFKETIARGPEKGEATPEDIAQEVNMLRSIYRTLFMDMEDEAERKDVTWAGLVDVLDRQTRRLAAIGGIPITRFEGTSATGLNATGDGDARDWRITVEATRKRDVAPVLDRIDMMLAKHVGLEEPPEYEWNKLGEMTDKEKAEVTALWTKAVNDTYVNGLVDEDEARERLAQDEFWGDLGDWTPSMKSELEEERKAEEAQRQSEEAMKLQKAKAAGAPPAGKTQK